MNSLNNYLQDHYQEEPLPLEQEENEMDSPESPVNSIKGITGLTTAMLLLTTLMPSCRFKYSCPPCLYRSKVDFKMHAIHRKAYAGTKKEYEKFRKSEKKRIWLEGLYLKTLRDINRVEGTYITLRKLHRGKNPSEAHLKDYEDIRKYLIEVQKYLKKIKKNFPNYYYIFNVLELKVNSLLNCVSRTVIGGAPCPSSPKPCKPRKTDEHIL